VPFFGVNVTSQAQCDRHKLLITLNISETVQVTMNYSYQWGLFTLFSRATFRMTLSDLE